MVLWLLAFASQLIEGPWIFRDAVYTVTGNTLVLNYGGLCDAS
jgi:hypothetical protein